MGGTPSGYRSPFLFSKEGVSTIGFVKKVSGEEVSRGFLIHQGKYGEDELPEEIDSERGFGSEGTNQPLTQIRIL